MGGPGTEPAAGAQELDEDELVVPTSLLLSAWPESARLSGAQATDSLTSAREVSLRPNELARDPDIMDLVGCKVCGLEPGVERSALVCKKGKEAGGDGAPSRPLGK